MRPSEFGRTLVSGEEGVRQELGFGHRLAIGFKGVLIIILIILTCTGIMAPVTVPLVLFTFRSLEYRGRFIGIGLLFESTLICLFLLGALVAIIISANMQ